jgi:putative phage-type endonuclease
MNAPTRHYIGGSNIAGILGVSPYKTPLDEYLTIVGEAPAPDAERQSFFRRRKSFEPVAAELFTERTGLQLVAVNRRLTDPEFDFLKAELDAETDDGANVEIKTVHPLAARDWGLEGGDACPVYVTAQAMHGLMVSGRQLAYVLAMIGFDDVRVYRIERDDETIAGLRRRETGFWREHVLAGVPPPPRTGTDVLHLFARDLGTVVEATPAIVEAVARLRSLKAEAKDLTTEIDALEEQVKLFMGGAASLAFDGQVLATWRSQTARRLDQKALEAAHPEIIEQFRKTAETRVLRIK